MSHPTSLDAWIFGRQPRPEARVRLFCFPFAGGGASIYRGWQALLPEAIEVCPVQLPGRENRIKEAPYTRVEPLVEALVPALAPLMDRPFALFGHSMGALIAFELACALRRAGAPLPIQLFASSRRAPQLPAPRPLSHTLSDEAFLARLRRYGGVPEVLFSDAEFRGLFLPLLRADFALHEAYVHRDEAPLATPLAIFGGTDDPMLPPEELEGWRVQTSASSTIRLFQGGHFYLSEVGAPLFEAIAGALAGAKAP